MSREIKYRVWDNENKSYNDPYSYAYYALTQDGGLDFYCHGDHMDEADPGVYFIEQYTGLKDKNGKEIYEGDIVEYLSYRKDYIGQVVFGFVDDSEGYYIEKHYGWGIYHDGYNTSLGDYADDNMRCELVEVIGNIHENKELLGGEE